MRVLYIKYPEQIFSQVIIIQQSVFHVRLLIWGVGGALVMLCNSCLGTIHFILYTLYPPPPPPPPPFICVCEGEGG